MPLNEELTWASVGKIVTDSSTGATVADAFQMLFGQPSKDLLPAGMLLYKFNDEPRVRPARFGGDPAPSDCPMSPWWTASLPYKHDGGLEQRLKIAQANGVSAREWGRLTSVIKEGWNSLAYLMEIKLKEPVYGWFGGFKGMARGSGPGSKRDSAREGSSGCKNLPGGGTQFYIPNLKFFHVASFSFREL
ncbi:MAG: hypothetical protein K1X57_06455 [Gemmataceae bacterium]|nr:hypothetical protein [Gemmataceae bacterium]